MTRSTFRRTLASALAVVLVAGTAVLANEGGHGPGAVEEPNIFFGSLVGTLVAIAVFLGLLAVLSKTAYPQILGSLKTREDKIRDSLEAAERAAADAKRTAAELEAQILASRQEAGRLVEEAKRNAELVAAAELAKARDEIKLERERALREMQVARDTAMQQIVDVAADWAVNVASKIVKRELKSSDQRDLISQAVDELRN